MFNMIDQVSKNSSSHENDIANIRSALTVLGYYDDTSTGLNGYTDENIFTSIKSYQADRKLKVDGILKPEGETHETLKKDINNDSKKRSTFSIYKRNREDMIKSNTIGADKYFHCKANYEAVEKGSSITGKALNYARETYGIIKGDGLEDVKEDMEANNYGQKAAKDGNFKSAKEACAIYRSKNLDEKY
jgi:peptidoglycan hydrolase-like protein with peptidoglycan-binding domain